MKTLQSLPQREALRDMVPWLPRVAAVTGVTVGLALSAPLIWGAVAAGMGLLALAAFGAFGVLVFQAMPLMMQRLENRLLSARKAEARANPIEQLQNDCMRRELRLASFRRALVEIGAQIENMRQMVDERRHVDPAHVLDKQERALQKMTQFHDVNVARLEQAHAALRGLSPAGASRSSSSGSSPRPSRCVMEALRPARAWPT